MNSNEFNSEQKIINALVGAFEKGYRLGYADVKNGVHIHFDEIKNHFVDELYNIESVKGRKIVSLRK